MGTGRSGTTLLDIVLGNASDIFSCGELISFPKLNGVPHGFGEGSKQYIFWKRVEESFFSKNRGLQYHYLVKTVNAVESHKTFYRNIVHLTTSVKFKEYIHFVNDFFESIFYNINENIVVDSSKYPGRALALSRQDRWQVDYIYLIRNPAGVVHSFSKAHVEQPGKNFISSNLYYFLIHFMCHFVKARIDKSRFITIRYEDFLQNTTEVLSRIEDELSLDLSVPISFIENRVPLKVGCLFEGNRIRLENEISISRKNFDFHHNWKDTVTTLLNGWWWRKGFEE